MKQLPSKQLPWDHQHIAMVFRISESRWAEATVFKTLQNVSMGPHVAVAHAGVDTDWREFRARLVRQSGGQGAAAPSGLEADEAAASSSGSFGSWAHVLKEPEKGCLLLAHPLMFTHQQTYFAQACASLPPCTTRPVWLS